LSSLAATKLNQLREELTQLAIHTDVLAAPQSSNDGEAAGDASGKRIKETELARFSELTQAYQKQLEHYVAYLQENKSPAEQADALRQELEFSETLSKRLNTLRSECGSQLKTIQTGKKARKNY